MIIIGKRPEGYVVECTAEGGRHAFVVSKLGNRVICPSCGLAWQYFPQVLPPPAEPGQTAMAPAEGEAALPHGGLARRVFGVGLLLLATLLVVIGILLRECGHGN